MEQVMLVGKKQIDKIMSLADKYQALARKIVDKILHGYSITKEEWLLKASIISYSLKFILPEEYYDSLIIRFTKKTDHLFGTAGKKF